MKIKLFFCLISLFLIISCNDNTSKEKIEFNRVKNSIDSIYNQLAMDDIFNGEILIAQENEIIVHKHYGKADLINNKDFSNESIFEIASVTKPFTALAIAKLVSEGKLSYDDFITKFFSELPYDSIKIKHLISHTSGLPDYNTVLYPVWDATKVANNQDLLDMLINNPPQLLTQPGSKWSYSNIGYTLLAIIIEKVQNQSFPNYCRDSIFHPLGMNNTIIPNYKETKTNAHYVNDYIFSFGDAKYIDPNKYPSFDNATFTGNMYGAQGICTNALDLYNFSKIFSGQSLLSNNIFNLYITPQGIPTTMSDDYTLGWFFDNDSILGKSLFYMGGFTGHRSAFQYFYDKETVIIIMNNTSTPIWDLKRIITACISNQKIEYPKKSYVKILSSQLQEISKNKLTKQNIVSFDSTIHQLHNYEFEELIEELLINDKYNLAIIASEIVSEIKPDYYKPFFHIGTIKYQTGNIEESLVYFNKALELNPNDTSIINQINNVKNIK